MELKDYISKIYEELENPSTNRQRKRYLEGYYEELIKYQLHNPESKNIPSSLELYCDLNPEAPECKIYDD
jgi:hypothetical protein